MKKLYNWNSLAKLWCSYCLNDYFWWKGSVSSFEYDPRFSWNMRWPIFWTNAMFKHLLYLFVSIRMEATMPQADTNIQDTLKTPLFVPLSRDSKQKGAYYFNPKKEGVNKLSSTRMAQNLIFVYGEIQTLDLATLRYRVTGPLQGYLDDNKRNVCVKWWPLFWLVVYGLGFRLFWFRSYRRRVYTCRVTRGCRVWVGIIIILSLVSGLARVKVKKKTKRLINIQVI